MFKVGDRVEATSAAPGYYEIGDTGTVVDLTSYTAYVYWDKTQKKTSPMFEIIKLIKEPKMTITHEQKLKALEDSVARWEENVRLFGNAKAGDPKEIRNQNCPLCKLYGGPSEDCPKCPLENCVQGNVKTLYSGIVNACNNAEAYTASLAMLARLKELLEEEKGREPAFLVGDIVIYSMPEYNGPNKVKEALRVITQVNGSEVHTNTINGKKWGLFDASLYTLIHRPSKD